MVIDGLKFKTNPWEHQLLAVKFLLDREQAALYTDMGTGKSKIIIDMIVNKGFKTVLIVCTNKGCEVWQTQFKLHSDIPEENVINLAGVPTTDKIPMAKEALKRNKDTNDTLVFLVNYEGVWREKFANYLMRYTVQIDCIVCDESHRIKSPASKCSRFLARLGRKTFNKYLVTGTPLAENPLDVYAQYRFLDPSIFGTNYTLFKERYQNVDIRRSMAVGYTVLDSKQPYKNLDELKERVFSVAFKMPSSIELPAQNDRIRHFRLSKKASTVYKRMCKENFLQCKGGEWYCEAENALTLMIRKKQIASGFVSTVNNEQERKIFRLDTSRQECLEDILDSLPPHEPVVIFAQYTYDLKRIYAACKACKRKYSELSGRVDTESDWQAGKTDVLGVQFSKGSESADFTRSRYIIYYTMTNRLALYLQSKKRIHRPGQTRSVYYIHLVADTDTGGKTIDSLVMEAVQLKKDIVDYVMEKEQENIIDIQQ